MRCIDGETTYKLSKASSYEELCILIDTYACKRRLNQRETYSLVIMASAQTHNIEAIVEALRENKVVTIGSLLAYKLKEWMETIPVQKYIEKNLKAAYDEVMRWFPST